MSQERMSRPRRSASRMYEPRTFTLLDVRDAAEIDTAEVGVRKVDLLLAGDVAIKRLEVAQPERLKRRVVGETRLRHRWLLSANELNFTVDFRRQTPHWEQFQVAAGHFGFAHDMPAASCSSTATARNSWRQ